MILRASIGDRSDSSISEFARRGIRVTGTLTALIGAFWLIAWMVGIVPQWSATGMITPKANMALAQLMGGVALLLMGFGNAGGLRRWAGAVLAALVMLFGALTLSEHLFGWNLGIDQLPATEPPGLVGVTSANRMGPPGSLSHMLLGIGLLALALRRRAIVPYLGLAVCVINLLPAVGFLYGISPFYGVPHLTYIVWLTVIALMSLGIGLVLSASDRRPVALLFSNDPGGRLLRRLLPMVLLITLTLGFLAVQIERRGIYEVETVTGLLTIVLILVFSVMLKQSARRLSRSSMAQHESEERLRLAQAAARIGTFEWNIRTDVNTWTPELEAMYGLQPGAFASTQQAWQDLVHPEDRAEALRLVERSFETGRPTEGEWRVVWPDGSVHWIFGRWQVFKDQSGEPIHMTGVNMDITERKRAEESVLRQNAVLDGINSILSAALTSETEGELGATCLAVAEEVTASKFGFVGEMDLEGTMYDIAVSDPGWEVCGMAKPKGHGKAAAGFKIHGIYGRVLLDGKGLYTNDPSSHPDSIGLPEGHPPLTAFLGAPLIHDGRTIGMVSVGNREGGYRDEDLEALEAITPAIVQAFMRRRAEESLHEREEDLKRAQAVAHTGSWRMDVQRNVLEWSEENHRVFGVPEGTPMTYETFLDSVHPDDREFVDREWMAALCGEPYDIEHRIIVGDTVRWVRERAELELDRDGELIGGFGTTEDITERKRTEQALHEAEESKIEFYRRMISAATDGKLVITERPEIERMAGTSVASWEIHSANDTKTVRHGVEHTARSVGMDEPKLGQLAVAVGEATTNTVKHAGGGHASLHCPDSRLMLIVSDKGPGIPALTLPDVALKHGYSTAGTLGMGYKLMIQFADRIHLATDEEGTTVAIEMKLGDGDTP